MAPLLNLAARAEAITPLAVSNSPQLHNVSERRALQAALVSH